MEDLLQCPICCINYDLQDHVPRQLPCQHILCSKCLPFMIKRKTGRPPYIECPIGKEEHAKSIGEIPKSLITIQLIDAMGVRRPSTSQNQTVAPSPSAQWSGAGAILTPTPMVAASAPLASPTSPTSPPYYLNQPIPLSTMPNNMQNTNPFLSNTNNHDDPFDLENLNRMQNSYKSNTNRAPVSQPQTAPYSPRQSPPSNGRSNSNNNFTPHEAPPSYDELGRSHRSPSINSNHQYTSQSTTNYHQNSNNQNWDMRTFLRKIFDEMDINRDGSITSVELQQALKRGQATSEFNIKTIDILIEKYDKNGDREISFDEFYDLYTQLNDEFENFLMMDTDGSGSIDIAEFSAALRKRGYNFADKFYKHLFDEIRKKTGQQGIMFDNYIRVAARFDYLCKFYRITPYYQKLSLEAYLKKTFFQNFW